MDRESGGIEEEAVNDEGGREEAAAKTEGRPEKKRRRRWPIVLLVIFGLLFLVAFGFYEYSNTTQFCNSCHIMNPYFEAWEDSSHNFVPCVDCHVSPEAGAKWDAKIQGMLQVMKYVTRTYSSRPYAEIEDEACLRSGCHSRRLVEAASTEEFKSHVVFDHAPHLGRVRRGRRLRCTSCHAQMVVGNHMEVTTTTCYLCHFRESDVQDVSELSRCRLCHQRLPDETIEHRVVDPDNPSAVIDTVSFNHADFIGDRNVSCRSCHINAIEGSGSAREDRCLDCHNVPEHLRRAGDIDFIHENHITEHNVTCERCHDAIAHEVRTLTLGMEQVCNRCHVATHGGPRDMYMGIGGRGVEESNPSSMYRALVDCSGCHVGSTGGDEQEQRLSGYTRIVSEQGCIDCHGEEAEFYQEAFDEYMAEVMERLSGARRLLSPARAAAEAATGARREELLGLLEEADYNIRFVELARGWAHNWDYSNDLLDAAEATLEEILEAVR